MKPPRLDPYVFQEAFQQGKFSPGIVITFQVMTFAWVSPRNPYPVSPMAKGIQDKFGAYTSCTGDANDPDI